MKRKELIIANVLLAVAVVAFGVLTVKLSINEGVGSVLGGIFSKDNKAQTTAEESSGSRCVKKPAINLTKYNTDPHISKLAGYQQYCSSYVTNTLMIFTGFSLDRKTATADSAVMAAKLKLFHEAGIKPIVIAEPYGPDGAVSYRDFLSGKFDDAMSYYFQQLKADGITDGMMGTWVPFPESNTPSWNNKDTEPRDFALCVNKYLGAMKDTFPKAKGSILLSAVTYEPTDLEYENGDYISLVPYLQELNKDYVTSVGIQGFPWVSRATTVRREIVKSSEFLQPDLAIEAAKELRTRDIWFNTGSFNAKYTNDDKQRVMISPNERKAVLSNVLATAKEVQQYQQNQYRVSVNLFSEDKSNVNEATDWSYGQSSDTKAVFREFISKANELSIPISLYDKNR